MGWNTGSVISYVHLLASSEVPVSVSGTNLTPIIEQQAAYVETYTGVAVDLNNIPVKYQGPLVDLTLAQVLRAIDIQEGGTSSVKLGELSLGEGGGGGNSETANSLIERAKMTLKELGRNLRHYKVYGV